MVIKEEIIDEYIENRLEFDLPKLTIKNKDYSVSGSGTVKLNNNGALELKLFSKKEDPIPFEYSINQYNRSLTDAGKLIPKEDFFVLSGKKNGDSYSCKQISVNIFDGNIIKGVLKNSLEILSPDRRKRKYKNAEIIINSNIDIPINKPQSTEIIYPNGGKYKNHSMNTFLIENNSKVFQMFNYKNYFLITIYEDSKIIDSLYIDNIINSLAFLVGKKISWNIIKLFNDHNEYKFLYDANIARNKESTISKPPFDFNIFLGKSKDSENLFINYFNFINADKKKILYKITNRNLLSSYSYLHVFGLTLSANIEELIKVYFKEYANNSSLKEGHISDAIKKINDLDILELFKKRISGLLQNINNIHVKDIFIVLREKKVLRKEEIDDWNKLRNASAHGDTTDNFDTQIHLDLVNKNLVLYHKIIFLIIGYKGLYSNYGIYGHPCDSFDVEI